MGSPDYHELDTIGNDRICRTDDGTRVLVMERTPAHFFYKFNSYPISDRVLDACAEQDVEMVHIYEETDDDVTQYEIPLAKYQDAQRVDISSEADCLHVAPLPQSA